jgi:hypothetical protein
MARDGIDRRAIDKLTKDLQREFDKHPIRIPMETDGPEFSSSTTIYNGPVFHGSADGAQLAWDNQTVGQVQHQTQQIAPGFEAIAQAVVRILEQLATADLTEEDRQDAESAADEVLAEVTRPEPDRKKIRRGLSALKGLLAPVATGLAAGTAEGAQEWAKMAIEQLGSSF